MRISKLDTHKVSTVNTSVPDPTPKTADTNKDIVNEYSSDVKTESATLADGDFSKQVPVGLDAFFTNPEFSHPADALMEAIRQYYVVRQGEDYDKAKIVETATKILESRG